MNAMIKIGGMSKTRRRWLYGIAGVSAGFFIALLIAGYVLSRRFEPFVREQAIQYMSERFRCDVQLAALHIKMPKMSPLKILLRHGRGVTARVEGQGISMRYKNTNLPQLFAIRKFAFDLDLGSLFSDVRVVNFVHLDGVEINVPPKGERQPLANSPGPE